LNLAPKLRSPGNAFIAPLCAFVWQIVQIGLAESENWRAWHPAQGRWLFLPGKPIRVELSLRT
jgi:hypothetical protein